MTSACSSNSFARSVTSPRSPGPAPTRKHFPSFLLLMLDLPENLRRQFLRVASSPARRFGCNGIAENLRTHFHFAVHKSSVHAHRQIAITLQQPQKFTFGS